MKTEIKKGRIHQRIPTSLEKRIDLAAQIKGKKRSIIIREAMEQYLTQISLHEAENIKSAA